MNLSRIFGRSVATNSIIQRAKSLRRRNRTRRLRLESLESRQLLTTILIGNSSANEGQDEIFQVYLSESSTAEISVSYSTSDGAAHGNVDYSPSSGLLVFAPGETTHDLVVHTLGNSTTTNDVDFTMQLSNPQNAELDMMQFYGTGTIVDTTPRVSVSGSSADEDAPVMFTINLSAAAAQPVVVTYATSGMSAAADQDFTSVASAVTIPAGGTSVQVAVSTLRDLEIEADEDFMFTLTSASNAAIDGGYGSAIGTIHEVPPPVIFVSDAATTEGQDLVFLVTLSRVNDESIRVTYSTQDFGNWANTSYVPTAGIVAFAPGETSHQVRVTTINDTWKQNGVTVNLNLTDPVNALLDVPIVPGTIADGPPALLAIGDASAREGNDVVFPVTLSRPLDAAITVSYFFYSGTAQDGDDFAPPSTPVTFAVGETSKLFVVPTIADPGVEGDEDFAVAVTVYDPALNVEVDPAHAMATGIILENHVPVVDVAPLPIRVLVDAAAMTVSLTGVFADADDDPLTISVAANSQPGLVSASISGDRLDLTFAAASTGSAELTLRATDPVGNLIETLFLITVAGDNTAPQTTGIADVVASEGAAPVSISLMSAFSDAHDAPSALRYFAASDNSAVVVAIINQDAGQLVLQFQPHADGEAVVTVGAINSLGLFTETQFHVTATPVNETPMSVALPLVELNQDSDVLAYPLDSLFADHDDALSTLNYEVVGNSNAALVTAALDLVTQQILITPVAGMAGNATITVRATDLGGLSTTSTLDLFIDARPVVSTPENFGISAEVSDPSATLNLADYVQDSTPGGLRYEIDSFPSSFVSAALVTPETGQLTLQFTGALEGSDTVVVRAMDARGNSALIGVPVRRPGTSGPPAGGGTKPQVWITAPDPTASESGPTGIPDPGQFQIHCTGNCLNLTVDFTVGGKATQGVDYGSLTGSPPKTRGNVRFVSGGPTFVTLNVNPIPDTLIEGPEDVVVTLSRSSSFSFGGTSSAIVTIADAPPVGRPTFTIEGKRDGAEQGQVAAEFKIVRTGSTTGSIAVGYTIDACTVTQQAGIACVNDLTNANMNGSITFNDGEAFKILTVGVFDDTRVEGNETLSAHINLSTNYIVGTPSSANVTILDNDNGALSSVSVARAWDASENGQTGRWTFTRTVGGAALTVNYEIGLCPTPSSACPADYSSPARVDTVTFAANSLTTVLDLTAVNDSLVEPAEYAVLTVMPGTGYGVVAPSQASVAILDNDVAGPVTISIGSAEGQEGQTFVFTVTLSAASSTPVSVKYYTMDGSATSPADYAGITQGNAQTISFGAGVTSVPVSIGTANDTLCEDDEIFSVVLTNPVNATILQGMGGGLIHDSADLPSVSVNNVTVVEGQTATFTLTLSKTCARPLTVNYHTADVSALGTPPALMSNADYNAIVADSKTIAAGQTTATVPVGTIDDTRAESTETFRLVVSPPESSTGGTDAIGTGTITDNDQSKPTIAINDVQVLEGDSGSTMAVFTVTISGAPISPVTVSYVTQDGSAIAGSPEFDYGTTTGSITFAGSGPQTISVPVNGDIRPEWNENFYVLLTLVGSGGDYATIVDGTGVGTIIDDDDGGAADAHLILHKAHCNCSCTTCDSDGQVTEVKDGGFIYSVMSALAALPAYMADGTFNTNPIFNVVLRLPAGSALPTRIEATPTVGSVVGTTKSFSVSGFQAGNEIAFAVQLDVSSLATGVYPLRIDAKAIFSDGKTASAKIEQPWIVINLLNSPFGGRWWLDALDRLVIPSPGSQLSGVGLVVGNNTSWWFQSYGTTYLSPDGLFASLTKYTDGTYEVRDKHGDSEQFNPDGLLTAKIDRNFNQTHFYYIDANGDTKQDELERIVDPSGRVTQYFYADGKLQKVRDYAGRETFFVQYAGFQTRVVPPATIAPDGSSSQSSEVFRYDAQGRLSDHYDALDRTTHYEYDLNDGRYRRSIKADGSVWTVEIAQRKGLPGSNQGDPLHPAAAISPSQVVALATDARNNSTTLQVDDYGNLLKRIDPLNNTYLVERDQHGHPVRSIVPDPDKLASGDGPLLDLVTEYAYDANGNLTTLTLPDGNTQSWVYEPNFSRATKFTNELGQVTNYQISENTGNVTKVTHLVRSIAAGPGQEGNPSYPWQNPRHKYDVNNDGVVSLADGNAILVSSLTSLPNPPTSSIRPPDYVDTNADGQISPIDALLVVNYVNALPDVVTNLAYTFFVTGVPNGLPLTVTDPLGRVTRYAYAASGNSRGWLQSVTLAEGTAEQGVVQFQYDLAGNVTAVIDELDRRTDVEYDARDRQIRLLEADPDGAGPLARPVTEFTIDTVDNTRFLKDARGNTTEWEYDVLDRVKKIKQPPATGTAEADKPTTQFQYDLNGNLTVVTNPLGQSTTYAYLPKMDWVSSVTLPAPGTPDHAAPVTLLVYDNVGNVIKETDPLGRDTTYRFDKRLRLVELKEPAPVLGGALTVTKLKYDAASELVGIVDPLNRETKYRFDDLGRQVSVKLPPATTGADGAVSVVDFDAASNPRFTVDQLGNVAERQFDARDRLIKSYDVDPDGTGPLSRPLMQFQFDVASQLTHLIDPLGRDTSFSFDALGRQIAIVSPDPDGAGQLLAPESQFVYDANGNVVESRERLDASSWLTTLYAFDNLDRATSVTDPNGQVTFFTYDKLGNRLTLTDPNANTTTWLFDNLNRVKEERNPLYISDPQHSSRFFHYDAAGNLTSQTDRNSRTINFVYDRLDRLTTETWVSGNRTLSYAYNAAGELTSAGDSAATYQYTLDGIGRAVTTTETRTGMSTVALNRTLDLANRQTQLAVTIGGVADLVNDYAYDAIGRVTSLTQHAATQVSGQPTPNAVAAKRVDFVYNSASQFQSLNRYSDLAGTQLVATSAFGYDSSGRLTSLAHNASGGSTLASYGWSFDTANRLTGFTNGTHPEESATYSNDNFGQLTGADRTGTSQDESFTYDANGNRTGGGYQTGANNRLTNDGTYTYTYDAEGNRTRRTKTSDGTYSDYTWDFRNRLTNVTEKSSAGTSTKAIDLVYDVFDRWIGDTVDADGAGPQSAVTSRFVYDGTQMLLAFEGGALRSRYLWGPAVDRILADEVVASTSSPGTARWMLTDQLNTVRDVIDNSGTVIDHIAYSSFGIIISQTNSSAQPRILWTGRPYESVLGLQNNWHRWYDPAVGRWVSEDPSGFGGGDENLTRYVSNHATMSVDPNGLEEHKKGARNSTTPKHEKGQARKNAQEARAAERCEDNINTQRTTDKRELERKLAKARETLESELKTIERRIRAAKGTKLTELQMKQQLLNTELTEIRSMSVQKGGKIAGADKIGEGLKSRLRNVGIAFSAVYIGQVCLESLEESIKRAPIEGAPAGATIEHLDYVFADEDGEFKVQQQLRGWKKVYTDGGYNGEEFPIDKSDAMKLKKDYEDKNGRWSWSWSSFSWKWKPGTEQVEPKTWYRGFNGQLYNSEWEARSRGNVF